METLHKIDLFDFELENSKTVPQISLTYQKFGQPIGSSPIVLVNHALTGNSNVTGENGWWKAFIGENKTINTNQYTIIAFNIPGNGYDGKVENLLPNYSDFTIRDIATLFWQGLNFLNISELFAVIGGSLGGAIAWEMAVIKPNNIQNLVPIAADWKATDWMIGNLLIQENILNNSKNPIEDARQHAMLLYRTPQSINQRFNRKKEVQTSRYEIESWLTYHGNTLKNRFKLESYKLMNHLLKTNDILRNRGNFQQVVETITSAIHILAVDTDYFFTPDENRNTFNLLKQFGNVTNYYEIKSIHGHDAFLMENQQLNTLLTNIFTSKK
jgi:homoserine O-acetyltransferase/O-succinyltransferase